MSDALTVAAAVVVGYVVGTFPTAVLVTRLATRGSLDIRTSGSGNPGGLNTAQVVGRVWGGVVMAVDAGKGIGAGLLGWAIAGPTGAFAGATAAIVGHIWPVWTGFRGGKGVATSAGTVLAVFPVFFPLDAAVAAAGALVLRDSSPDDSGQHDRVDRRVGGVVARRPPEPVGPASERGACRSRRRSARPASS